MLDGYKFHTVTVFDAHGSGRVEPVQARNPADAIRIVLRRARYQDGRIVPFKVLVREGR